MGMAASQARYLALTARKTNCEWEGQQINQARTALANQSANLFNQLLALDVPNAPKTTDYTELQYSFSDGANESVIDHWQQLSNANPDYNYVVNSYYYANLYTGSKKLLENPEVHVEQNLKTKEFENPSSVIKDELYNAVLPDGTSITCENVTNEKTKVDETFKEAFNNFATAKDLAYRAGAIPDDDVYGYQDSTGTWHFYLKEEIATKEKISSNYIITNNDGTETYTYSAINNEDIINGTKFESSLRNFEEAVGLAQKDGILTTDDVYGYCDSIGTWHFFVPNEESEMPQEYISEQVMYIGNCKATELTSTLLTDNQKAELSQVLRDCSDSAISKYLKFNELGELDYIDGKGVYSFQMNGQTYFTTEADLYNSINTPHEANKPIEIQNKLTYYNASYIQSKIEATNNALLETDGNGRFTSVKFDNDSVIYSLNTETVTDEAAYQDAMNEYMYKKAQYEKTIADINAQTSIIQQEDRTLELRLKQLDTEQNALATEMDAVKKVIKDNVEKTFKTFSD